LLNDIWEFDFKNQTWNELKTSGTIPDARYGHELVYYKDSLFVFGGCTKYYDFKSVHHLDLKTLKWNQVKSDKLSLKEVSGTVFTSTVVSNDNIFFYGGIFKEKTYSAPNEESSMTFLKEPKKLIIESYVNPKFTIIGPKSVGKTCLLITYVYDSFPSENVPTSLENFDMTVNRNDISLEIGLFVFYILTFRSDTLGRGRNCNFFISNEFQLKEDDCLCVTRIALVSYFPWWTVCLSKM
jgi:hypothetical protein